MEHLNDIRLIQEFDAKSKRDFLRNTRVVVREAILPNGDRGRPRSVMELVELVRRLTGFDWSPAPHLKDHPLAVIAFHHFNERPEADKLLLGALINSLYPDVTDAKSLENTRLGLDALMRHAGVNELLFSNDSFHLFQPIYGRGIQPEIVTASVDELTRWSHIEWTGRRALGELMNSMFGKIQYGDAGGDPPGYFFAAFPRMIRVHYTPSECIRALEEIREVRVKGVTVRETEGGNGRETAVEARDYVLFAIVELDVYGDVFLYYPESGRELETEQALEWEAAEDTGYVLLYQLFVGGGPTPEDGARPHGTAPRTRRAQVYDI
ncbi:hypothetical protein DL769_000631 [Monosporascus sp. CRB-8-3]|nr:hypothetical protein DL769_000631 [Monosporascus sp. CRB-8-3]